jgi:hypothetical protein
MLHTNYFSQIELSDDEQVVLAVKGMVIPVWKSHATHLIFVALFPLILLVYLHRFFRPIAYMITTKRVIALDQNTTLQAIHLKELERIRCGPQGMMLYAGSQKMWLSRIQDTKQFEATIQNVRRKFALK